MAFKKAVRQKVYVKVLITGPAGSGKSQSATEMATGLFRKCGGTGIAYIGTEGDRDLLYAQKKSAHGDYYFEYDLCQLQDPFTTDKYILAINEAIDAGYKVCIIDGLSAEWKWLNDTHDKMPGNSFTNWGKLKPKHRQLLDCILSAPMHIICCARGKDEWILEDKNGKSVPKKVGLGSQTDKDISYEVMLSLQLEQDSHLAHSDKDNTGLWPETRFSVINAKDGEALYEWCEQGEVPAPKPVIKKSEEIVSLEDELATMHSSIIEAAKAAGGSTNELVKNTIKKYTGGSPNPKAIKDIEVAKQLLEELKSLS